MQTPPRRPAHCVVGTAIAFEGSLLLLAAVIGWAVAVPPFGSAQWSLRAAVVGALATTPALAGLALTLRVTWEPFRRLRELADRLVAPLFLRCGPLALLAIAAAAGVAEEAMFRGVLQPAVGRAIGDLGGLVAASILFGAAHSVSPLYAVLAGGMGLYLGALVLVTGNLVVPIVAHGLYDLVALWYLIWTHPSPGRGSTPLTDEPT